MAQKTFVVASISKNANSLGLFGHVLIAADGEAWEAGRCNGHSGYDTKPGDKITIDTGCWGAVGFEIPRRLPQCPPDLLANFWPKQCHGAACGD